MSKAIFIYLNEPECIGCLIGSFYRDVEDIKRAIKRGESVINTTVTAVKIIAENVFDEGYSVYVVVGNGDLLEVVRTKVVL